MNVRQARIAGIPLATDLAPLVEIAPQLVLVFGSVKPLTAPGLLEILEEVFPQAELAGCTTAGEIGTGGVTDGEIVITALHFSQSRLRLAVTDLADMEDSRAAGRRLGRALAEPELVHVLVLGQGVQINGSALIEGFADSLPGGVMLSGGLAGDGGAFSRTWTLSRHGLSERQIVAIGFSGRAHPLAPGLLSWMEAVRSGAQGDRGVPATCCMSLTGTPRWTSTSATSVTTRRTCPPRACCFLSRCWAKTAVPLA
jgi:hypothetical protein